MHSVLMLVPSSASFHTVNPSPLSELTSCSDFYITAHNWTFVIYFYIYAHSLSDSISIFPFSNLSFKAEVSQLLSSSVSHLSFFPSHCPGVALSTDIPTKIPYMYPSTHHDQNTFSILSLKLALPQNQMSQVPHQKSKNQPKKTTKKLVYIYQVFQGRHCVFTSLSKL